MKLKPILPLLALTLAVGCGPCAKGPKGKPAEEFIEPDATFALAVPSLGALAKQTTALSDNLRTGPAGQKLVQMQVLVARQLGFDPFKEEGLMEAGLDPAGSFAAGGGEDSFLIALPVKDKAKAEETLVRLVRDKAGAGVSTKQEADGLKVTLLAQTEGGAPVLAYAQKDGFLLGATGAQAVSTLTAALRRKPEDSLARSSAYTTSKTRVGNATVYLMLPRPTAHALALLPDAALVGLSISPDEVALRAFVNLSEDGSAGLRETFSGGGQALLPLLPNDAPVYVRAGVNLRAFISRAEKEAPGASVLNVVRASALASGFDLDAELFDNLEPGFALALGISPTAELSKALEFNINRTNPFDTYTLFGVGTVKDEARAKATLAKLPEQADAFGLRISVRELDGRTLYTAHYHQGETLTWTLAGKKLIVAGGMGDGLGPLIASVAGNVRTLGKDAFSPRAGQALFKDDGIAFSLDLGRVHRTLNSLPASAFGQGAGAFMAKSVATGVIAPLAPFRGAIALAPADGGLIIDISAQAQTKGK